MYNDGAIGKLKLILNNFVCGGFSLLLVLKIKKLLLYVDNGTKT